MTLLDAYALVAFLAGGPARAEVENILRQGDVGISPVNLVEVLDVCERVHRVSIARAQAVLDPLLAGPLALVALGADTAFRAAKLRVTHYHGRRCPISLADCVLLASAADGDRIVTPDPDVLAVAATEQIGTLTIPGG